MVIQHTMKTTGLLLSFVVLLSFNACKQDNIRIMDLSKTRVGRYGAGKLERYLNQSTGTYHFNTCPRGSIHR